MAAEIPTLVWEELDPFPPLENISEGEDEPSDVSIFVSDHDVLDCSICCEPLKPPIFQCLVGHVCCSSCCQMLSDKCHICCRTTGHNRCFAMEKLVTSTKVTCTNKRYGCNAIMPYYKLKEHEETCFHLPCYCPYANCYYTCGCKRSFRKHMKAVHKERVIDFRYDEQFKVGLSKASTFKVLANKDFIFFLHKRDEGSLGVYALSIVCMRPSHFKEQQFWYEIKTDCSVRSSEDRYLQLRSKVESCIPKGGFKRSKFSLLVQPEFCLPNGDIHVFVQINKVKSNDTS
ncbi:E3 ubiquitin-protein ligase SINA-like 10 [Carex rostrata]